MENLIVIMVIIAIVTSAIAKIVIEKRKGAKCIGCPSSQTCSSNCSSSDIN